MSEPRRYSTQVWDSLFEMLYACDESLSDAEIDADLQRERIDVRPALRHVQQLIEQANARDQLSRAAETRLSMIDKLRGIVTPQVENLRAGIKGLIDRAFPESAQVAHYQKLEKAASEEDLRSLLDDLTKLAALRQDQDESKAE